MNRLFPLLVILCLLPGRALGAGPELKLAGPVGPIAAGEQVALIVTLTDIENLYGFEVHLRFDPLLLQVVSPDGAYAADAGDLMPHDFVALNRFDNSAGTVDYAATEVSPHEPISGSGSLIEVRFKTLGGGKAQVHIDSFVLSDRDGMALAATVSDAEVTVGGPIPAESATPTAAATAPMPTQPAALPPTVTPAPVVPPASAIATPDTAPLPSATPVRSSTPPATPQPVAVTSPTLVAPRASARAPSAPPTTPVSSHAAAMATRAATVTPTPTAKLLAAAKVATAAPAPMLVAPVRVEAASTTNAPGLSRTVLSAGLALLALAAVIVGQLAIRAIRKRPRREDSR